MGKNQKKDSGSEEGPPTLQIGANNELFPEKEIVARQGNVTETTQLDWSDEFCNERRESRFDETGNLTGARFKPLSGMLTRLVCLG